jgi:hypothetical protein
MRNYSYMLNLVTPDIDDQKLLENSYNSIRRKDILEIVTSENEKERILSMAINSLRKPGTASFSFQNLFKLKYSTGYFYIAQILIDYNYPTGNKGSQTFYHKYSYHTIGIANLSIDLGITNLRPEMKIDKLVDWIFKTDIDFESSQQFSDKYYLASNKKESAIKYFDGQFIKTISKYDDILLSTNGSEIYISFVDTLVPNQSRIIEEILSTCKFLSAHDCA